MHLVWYCIIANVLHVAELHIGSSIRYETTLFRNPFLKCYIVKIISISFNCFSEK